MNEKFYALLEYLEMINHWEMVYGKGTENDRKQLKDLLWQYPLFCKYNR